MRLVKIKFFCALAWKWQELWILTPNTEDVTLMEICKRNYHYSPIPYSQWSDWTFRIDQEIDLNKDGIVDELCF